MKVTIRHVGSVSILDLAGKITIGEGDITLRDKIGELLDSGQKRIVLNLEQISYMDSAGLGELAACYKRAQQLDATLKVLNPSGKVASLFQMIRLGEMIETYGNEQEAVDSF
jgi:anti-sigma B factor antagonist